MLFHKKTKKVMNVVSIVVGVTVILSMVLLSMASLWG